MKIVIDGVFFQLQQQSGIVRVWRSLLEEWIKEGFAPYLLLLDRAGTAPKIPGLLSRTISPYDYNNTDADRQLLQQICTEEGANLFISTYYTTPLSTPSVFITYDMIPEVMGVNLDNPMWREKHYAIRQASHYLAISHNTARDLVKFFPEISLDSVTIAHCGITREFAPASSQEIEAFYRQYQISKPYFMVVGDRVGVNGYKNTLIFFQALSQLSSKWGFEIVCTAGHPSLERELQAYTAGLKVHLLRLSDSELKAAYSGAIALVFTSKYEGFGLPVLEAMACGCPVITCPNSSIPEVAGEAALYVPENDLNGLINALLDVQKPTIRSSLIRAGLGQARKFSWSKMAKTVSSVLLKACGYQGQIVAPRPQLISSPLTIIEQYQKNPSDASALEQIRQVRQQIAESWLNLPAEQLPIAYSGDLGGVHKALLGSGIKDEPLTEREQVFVNSIVEQVAQGFEHPKAINYLLAALLYQGVHQFPLKYERAPIPAWFANDYLRYMFTWPNFYKELGEVDCYYNYFHQWLTYIHAHIFNNLEAPLWQNIAGFFSQVANFIPLYFTTANLRDLYEKRAEILEQTLKNQGCQLDYQFPERPGDRTKIRLGILNDHFQPQTETFATIPIFEHLDRNQFEIFLYACNVGQHPLEQYCQSRVDKLVALPNDFNAQVQMLRADDLDILFIGTNLTAVNKPTTSLALHRLARIQTTSFCSPTTTGMRRIDYYISGQFTTPENHYQEQYTEQLIALPGSGFCFRYATESEVATVKPTRASLGISEGMTVFISGANFFKILPELRETWAKILVAVPNSILILYPFGPAWTRTYPATPFIHSMQAIFAKHGVELNRLQVLKQLPSRGDVKEFLQLADVYLDSYPYAGATSLIDPLQVGLPTVTIEGNALRFRQGSAMLRELGIPDLIANSEASYIQLATALGTNAEFRQQKRQHIQQKMRENPAFLNSQAYGVSIGNLFRELFQRWQNNQSQNSAALTPASQKFLNEVIACVNLYHIDSSAESVIEDLRQLRKQFADYWLNAPAVQLETLYQTAAGKAYQALLTCGFQNQPMSEQERIFLQQLTQISKGLVQPKAFNALLGAMLYFVPGTMRVPDARSRLPRWLIEDYEQVFEQGISFTTEGMIHAANSQSMDSPQLLNQVVGCANLYRIDPTDESVLKELRELRKLMAEFWSKVPASQLEPVYQSPVGIAYKAIIQCGIVDTSLLETEQTFLNSLLAELGKGLAAPQAMNYLLAALLYCRGGQLRIQEAGAFLPQWFLKDWEKLSGSVANVGA